MVVFFILAVQTKYTHAMHECISFGGAAGNCPPVRKVTGYSSTSIVCL